MTSSLIAPHGGSLSQPMAAESERAALAAVLPGLASWTLTRRQAHELELLLDGSLSPLAGYMGQADYDAVLADMRLADGTLWPLPMVLDVDENFAAALVPGDRVALRGGDGSALAVLELAEAWRPDKAREAKTVFGSAFRQHPGVAALFDARRPVYLAGRVRGLEPPRHSDFRALRLGPRGLRDLFGQRGWRRVLAVHADTPLHRADLGLARAALKLTDAAVLLHPVIDGGDAAPFAAVRCWRHALARLPRARSALALLPLPPRWAGPREALLHAIIRRNYGCSHILIGPDHGSPPGNGRSFYAPYDAQRLLEAHRVELGIQPVPVEEMRFSPRRGAFVPSSALGEHETGLPADHGAVEARLARDEAVPGWLTYPEVVRELERGRRRRGHGFTLMLSGSGGAEAVADRVIAALAERGGRAILLGADGGGEALGRAAADIARHGGVAVCAAESAEARLRLRQTADTDGVVEVELAGGGDAGDINIDLAAQAPDEVARRIVSTLEDMGYIAPAA